jgi:hypothetical protein
MTVKPQAEEAPAAARVGLPAGLLGTARLLATVLRPGTLGSRHGGRSR